MEVNYTELYGKILDPEIKRMFETEKDTLELLDLLVQPDILVPSSSAAIPFFASIRDYSGASYINDPDSVWIIKPIHDEDVFQARLGMVVYLLNHFTATLSAPTIVTKINGVNYKASKVIPRTEQLSGAGYHETNQLSVQLALDLINSWVYFDEDRNPNNYLIFYNSRNIPVVITIDFSNVDLMSAEMKVKGREDTFGWERQEKTRYLTPLKNEQFYELPFEFYQPRFERFLKLDTALITKVCETVFSDLKAKERKSLAHTVAKNIVSRIAYVNEYFTTWLGNPEKVQQLIKRSKEEMKDEYRLMGKFFNEQLNQ